MTDYDYYLSDGVYCDKEFWDEIMSGPEPDEIQYPPEFEQDFDEWMRQTWRQLEEKEEEQKQNEE